MRARAAELAVEHPGLADVFDQLAEGIAVEGMESLAPVLVDGMELLLDLLPAGTARRACCDPERVRTRAHDLVATSQEFLARVLGRRRGRRRQTPLDLGAAAYRSAGRRPRRTRVERGRRRGGRVTPVRAPTSS